MTEQTERLLQLAEFLDALPRKQFEIGEWYSEGGQSLRAGGKPYVGCGTVACAMGWAPAIFPELIPEPERIGTGAYFRLNGISQTGFSAACILFGLRHGEACSLFSSRSYGRDPRPSDVATRIYRFVRTGECN